MQSQAISAPNLAVKSTPKKKVFVGVSGGVDSSVSAGLLVQAGYDVTGVFIKVWQPDWIECTWREDRRDAMRVCARLGIPFVTLDLENEYKKGVVDYMISEYKAGRTPNPDVMCNREVKFGAFYDWAMKHGADYIATGHYAQTLHNQTDQGKLLVSADKNKDQTYFLWQIRGEQLSKILFPIGHLQKSEVRKLAEKLNLPNAGKKDSQGLCFIGKIDIKEFLSTYITPKKGNVIDEKGNIIGFHDGAVFLTIGERHGFTITKKSPNEQPYFVIDKDAKTNTVTVSHKDVSGALPIARRDVKLSNTNWNQGLVPVGVPLLARTRYREKLSKIVFNSQNEATFNEPHSTLSPGQSLVVYDGDICLGGGIIENRV